MFESFNGKASGTSVSLFGTVLYSSLDKNSSMKNYENSYKINYINSFTKCVIISFKIVRLIFPMNEDYAQITT